MIQLPYQYSPIISKILYCNTSKNAKKISFWNQWDFIADLRKIRASKRYPTKLSTNQNEKLLQIYPSALNSVEKELFLRTASIFSSALRSANITYLIYGGTVIGSRRHHGFIPWDDDVDVWINKTEKKKCKKILSSIPNFGLFSPNNFQWKFFYKKLNTLKELPFRWPYIDIFYFEENATHIWDELPPHRTRYYKKSIVFPLYDRPFDAIKLPAPCSIDVFIGEHPLNDCAASTYNHRMERAIPKRFCKRMACSTLYHLHPFVFRTKHNETHHKEELRQNNTIIHEIFVPTNLCAT